MFSWLARSTHHGSIFMWTKFISSRCTDSVASSHESVSHQTVREKMARCDGSRIAGTSRGNMTLVLQTRRCHGAHGVQGAFDGSSENRHHVKTLLTCRAVQMRLFLRRCGLRCSFCGKVDSQVAKLLGGSRAHICDVCVGVCNRILEATPSSFSGWEAMTNDELLGSLRPAVATVEATRAVLQMQVDTLRKRDVSWSAIGEALGISRQAAWERFS